MIKNLTPHVVNIYDASGEELLVTLPSEGLARCAVSAQQVGDANGVPLYKTAFGEVSGLPDAEEGTILVVALLVRQALPDRADLASPGELIRDGDGKPVGCKGLAVN